MIVLIRLFLGYIFFSAGLCKLTLGHFGQIIGPPTLETILAKYGLGLFAQVVAVLQVSCGALLLTQRFATMGAIKLMPMNISILAVTVSMHWAGTPYVNAFFILLNAILLLYDWHKLKIMINPTYIGKVKTTALDAHQQTPFYLISLLLALATLLTARISALATNALAVAAFVLMGYSIIKTAVITRLQSVIVALVLANMICITLAESFQFWAQQVVMYNTCLILVLVVISLIKSKDGTHVSATQPHKQTLCNTAVQFKAR